jgi:hypothetical protein
MKRPSAINRNSPKVIRRKTMKRVLIAMLFMLPALACAEKKAAANPADYSIAVHVQSSQLNDESSQVYQQLNVIIGGKHYELEAFSNILNVLPAGDYMARITKDQIDKDKEYLRVYELLFAEYA